MSKSRRGPAPIPGAPVTIRVECCPKQGSAIVRFLGRYFGTFTHYRKIGSIPCPGDEGECPAANHKARKIWKGFAPAEYYRGGQYGDWCPCVWEVTEALNEILDGVALRGTVWELTRVPGECGKPEVSGVLVATVDERDLRPAFDVFPHVSRMYGFLPMQWDVKSHIPARLRLQPSKGEPPPTTAKQEAEKPNTSSGRSPEELAEVRRLMEEGRKVFGLGTSKILRNNGHAHETNGKGVNA